VISVPQFFFGYFAVAMILISILIITAKNPVNSVLWMLALFFHIAGLYLFLNAEFLAAVQLILYAGAILVLFLFVIMMLNVKEEITGKRFMKGWPIGIALAVSVMLLLYLPISRLVRGPIGQYTIAAVMAETNAKTVGRVLFTDYLFPFEIASLILLIAIVGAMVLAKKRT
jgi:NADH-quinone oxidoreductase subunit J